MSDSGFRKIRIDAALWNAALSAAQQRGETVTSVVNAALRAYVEDPIFVEGRSCITFKVQS